MKLKRMNKALSILLSVCMALGLLPWTVLPARADVEWPDAVEITETATIEEMVDLPKYQLTYLEELIPEGAEIVYPRSMKGCGHDHSDGCFYAGETIIVILKPVTNKIGVISVMCGETAIEFTRDDEEDADVYTFIMPAGAVTVSPIYVTAVLSGDNVTIGALTYTYTGIAIEPALTVKDGNTTLTQGTDYTVSYKQNGAAVTEVKNAGEYTATIIGKGDYAGTVEKTFTVVPKTVTASGITAENKEYDGTNTATFDLTGATVGGVVTGEALTVSAVTGTFAQTDAGTGVAVTITGVTLASGNGDATKPGNYTVDLDALNTALNLTADITVTILPTGVSLNNHEINVFENADDQTLTATISPAGAAGTLVWFSNYENVASVTGNGDNTATVTISGVGTANVTVTIEGTTYSDVCVVNVSEYVCPHANKTEYQARPAGCTEWGNNRYFQCNDCGKYLKADGTTETTVEAETIPAQGHSWGNDYESNDIQHWRVCLRGCGTEDRGNHSFGAASYTWSADNSTCTAVHTCTVCGRELTETMDTTPQIKTEATCTGKEITTYSASFTKSGFAAQSKDVETRNALGHDFTYAASGATVTATCGTSGCAYHSAPVVLTLAAPTLAVYGGTGSAASTVTGLVAFNAATGLSVAEADVRYEGRDGTSYTASASAPAVPGKYTARITVYGATASVDYEIEKATVTITAKDQSIYVGAKIPALSEDSYTVAGVKSGDTLKGNLALSYRLNDETVETPDTSKAGTYVIVLKGAEVPNGDNYNQEIVYKEGKLTISAKPSGGGGGGSFSTTPTTTSTPAEDNKTTNADGSVTESTSKTTETKNADGSTTATTTSTATTTGTDGAKTEMTSETATTTKQNADGSTTDTTKATEKETVTDASGAKSTTEKTTESATTTKENADGGVTATTTATETATTTAADGTKTVTEKTTEATETLDRNGNGTVEGTTTETVTDASGKVLESTVTESKGTVATDENGTKITTTTNTATTTDAEGNVTTIVTIEEKAEAKDGTVTAIVKDENGNVLAAEANVTAQAVEEAQKAGEPVQVPMEVAPVTAENAANAVPVAITMPTASTDGGSVAKMPRVEIAVPKSGPGIIAMIRNALGKLIPVKECREGSIILPVESSCEVVIVDNTKTFGDVSADDWFSKNVTFVTAREIFNGMGDGRFDPNAAMTRGMLAQVLYNFDRNATPDGEHAFADASGEWYADAASWAAYTGVVTGTGKGFEGETNVSREAVATMLYRYAKALGCDVSASGNLSAFADAASVSDWAQEAMRWAVGAGLINGNDGALDPQGSATRAQLAAIMERFVENVVK